MVVAYLEWLWMPSLELAVRVSIVSSFPLFLRHSHFSMPQEAYVPTNHVNSPAFKGQAGEKVSAWDPSAAAAPPGRGIRPRTPAEPAADTKDILDLK